MMDLSSVIFILLALIIIISSAAVLITPNPIYAAFSLAITMICFGFLYFLLNASFIAGVQLIVYAGAVLVLFVMVLMLFDLRKETEAYSKGNFSALLKLLCGLVITGAIAVAIRQSIFAFGEAGQQTTPAEDIQSIKMLAGKLFTQYVFAFEALGILLLVVAVGVVAVARARGGTHAKH
jgi:NADH-quinone oxidoreductase subunit J